MSYLMFTAIIVFVGIWTYMVALDVKIAKLRRELHEDSVDRDGQ